MCAEVALQSTYQIADKAGAERWEYQPAIRIARLACCDGHRDKKIGRQLVETAIGIVLLSIVPNAGCRFLILDAKPTSIGFYRHMGFRLLDTPQNKASATPVMFMDLRDLIDAAEAA
jgi:GNAT superfamily N-acetyltransferase